ncbi:membrane protein [Salmonella enterica subsp. arizonae]|uniref:Membrane protein n=1 Tax=Salmonella enterica subsp. arizonae TaxID=59203 RepID=A0A379TM21_SALER|nr:membrane protein [Salmonella enterica subsp. arizonae]
MDKKNFNSVTTLEEQLVVIVDKYISKRYQPGDKSFSNQLYLVFVGYHLKYFYPRQLYTRSNRNIDNIMTMFSSVYKCLTSNLLRQLYNKEAVLRELNSLVNYIDNNQEKAEEIYATVRAQYEMKVIEGELTHEVRVRTVRL